MKTSAISWTDFSGGDLNFVTGCTLISEGCQNCYARAIYGRWGKDFGTVTIHEDKLARIHKGRPSYSPKRGAPHRPMAFVCDTGDLFHESVPEQFAYNAFYTMANCFYTTWQVLTKRPARMHYLLDRWRDRFSFDSKEKPNIWLGVTAENQQRADERIPLLLDTPAAVRFVSVEPMLGPVDLTRYLYRYASGEVRFSDFTMPLPEIIETERLDWVICGAESGPNRRPFAPMWAADLYEQCKDAGVPFFGKQHSGLRPGVPLLIDGQVVHEWPQ